MRRSSLIFLMGLIAITLPAAAPPLGVLPLTNGLPRTPAEELTTFEVPAGFRVELVASEPQVVDPVAMAFDEQGRIWLCEMRGYPNGGRGTGFITSGRIKLLEDRDGDGTYETSNVWAENLRFPTGIMPWKGGVLVANAPDLLFLKDTRGTGKADLRQVLYTGFDVANIQQLLNSLQFSLDNWVHGVAGLAGGNVTCLEKPGVPMVSLRGRGVRFKPHVPGSVEPTSGGGQYGLTADDWGRWFTATNSQHLRHVILPDHYLRRNPALPVSAVTLDIPEHGAACRVFRRSPFEAWRVVRTSRRAGSADAKRFASTELVPGGFVTSGCSPLIYNADQFPPEYRNSIFVCDPANNLILRDTLSARGATFVAHRGHPEKEFLASTDNWFRPVHLTLGPDGAIYVLDFYREVIETPLSLPEDILRRVMVESRGRGRIWRITTAPEGTRPPKVALHKADSESLVKHLADKNPWWRLTAQRLLVERRAREAIPALHQLIRTSSPVGRAHAAWCLDELGELKASEVLSILRSDEAGLREQGLKLAETRLSGSVELRAAVLAAADDPSPRVRFQCAFTLGQLDTPESVAALAKLARRADNDRWTETAILSSASRNTGRLLESLARDKQVKLSVVSQLASMVGTTGSDAELGRALALLGNVEKEPTTLQLTLLDGLGRGLSAGSRSLAKLWEKPPVGLEASITKAKKLFEKAGELAVDESRPLPMRIRWVTLLGRGPFAPLAEAVPTLLNPRSPPEVQLATVRALSNHPRPEVAGLLLRAWSSAGPTLRREMTEALFARKERLESLVSALEAKQILALQLEPQRLAQLKKLSDAKLRARAVKVLAGQLAPERTKVIASYRSVFDLKSEANRGKIVFKKHCATCHRLEEVGVQVGADLQAALRNKSGEALLIDVLDPSREVDPRFLSYQVTTNRGQVLSGIIAAETATSMTLKRGEGAEDTILRTQIESIESTGKSLMPEGLELQINKQEMADLIRYLLQMGRK